MDGKDTKCLEKYQQMYVQLYFLPEYSHLKFVAHHKQTKLTKPITEAPKIYSL